MRRKRWPWILLRIILILIVVLGAFLTGIFINCEKHEKYIETHKLLQEEKKYSESLVGNVKWFMSGYIRVYYPGRFLYNGARVENRNAAFAAHPYLPIGTRIVVENQSRNIYTVLPILDRKTNIGDRQILMINSMAAEELDWHYDDHFMIIIMDVPPAYGENIWYEDRSLELQMMTRTKLLRRRKW